MNTPRQVEVASYDSDGWPLDMWGRRIPKPLGGPGESLDAAVREAFGHPETDPATGRTVYVAGTHTARNLPGVDYRAVDAARAAKQQQPLPRFVRWQQYLDRLSAASRAKYDKQPGVIPDWFPD